MSSLKLDDISRQWSGVSCTNHAYVSAPQIQKTATAYLNRKRQVLSFGFERHYGSILKT